MKHRLLSLVLVLAASSSIAGAQTKNVVFIMADDLNTMVNSFGYSHAITPNIDRLAARGVSFQKAYVQQAFCGPSRTSILSGLNPWTTGIAASSRTPIFRDVFPNRTHFAEHFKNNGYFTASYGKVDHWPDGTRSWDVTERPSTFSLVTNSHGFVWPGMPVRPAEQLVFSQPSLVAWGTSGNTVVQAWDSPDDQFVDGQTATRSAQTIRDRAATGDPFFVAAGFFLPHSPYVAPKRFFDMYDPAQIPIVPEPPYAEQDISWWQLSTAPNRGEPAATESQRRDQIRAYLAGVSYMDWGVGQVLDVLDELDLWDDTIVVFMSDHGYMLGEHEIGWSKQRLWEECLRIPLIIWDPDAPGNGLSCHRVVQAVDVYPTVVQAAGLALPEQVFDGRSLEPLLQNPGNPWSFPALSMKPYSISGAAIGRAITNEQYRYEDWIDGTRALYDLVADPRQQTNLYNSDLSTRPLADFLATGFPDQMTVGEYRYYARLPGTSLPEDFVADRDGDGLLDEDELEVHGTDVAEEDTEGDGVDDGSEIALASLGFSPFTDDADRLALVGEHRAVFDLYSNEDVSSGAVAGGDPVVIIGEDGKLVLNWDVFFSSDLENWETSTGTASTDTDGSVRWEDEATLLPRGFYRVEFRNGSNP